MGLTRRFNDNQNQLTESALDADAMELLQKLRYHTGLDEVTDEA